jgi:hypothetical protein
MEFGGVAGARNKFQNKLNLFILEVNVSGGREEIQFRRHTGDVRATWHKKRKTTQNSSRMKRKQTLLWFVLKPKKARTVRFVVHPKRTSKI